MPYLIQYQYSYKQKIRSASETVQVTLFKKSSLGTGTPVITQLVASKPAFKVNVIDNDKDKFREVRGKQATLLFKPQTGITASTFSSGPDDEWIVEAVVVSTGFVLFKGFLVMDDHQQSFLPISHNYDIELTATDNLGTLKEVPLTDFSGNYPRRSATQDYFKIIELIAFALAKTGMQLDILVRDSWMEESQTAFGPACDVTYLKNKTFEKDINEAVDCYTALEIIFGYRLSIKQYNGTWWIENIDEKTTNQAYLFRFDYTGTYVGQEPLAYYIEAIGKNEEIKLLNKDAILSYTRPIKYAQLAYKYEFPKEIIDNIDFSRGSLFTPLDMSPVTIDGKTYYQKKLHIEDWTALVGSGGIEGLGTTTTTNNYIRKLYSDAAKQYEVQRYVVIEHTTGGGAFFLRSDTQIPVNAQDKFTISVDAKFQSDVFPGSGYMKFSTIQVRLFADDGTRYTLNGGFQADPQIRWVLTSGSFSSNNNYVYVEGNGSDDWTEWKTASAEAAPVPKSGTIQILLIHNQNSTYQTDRWFSNLQFDYNPYLNGSYSKYGGHSFKIEQAGNYKANIDDTVQLGDSPCKLFKGAMFKLVGGSYVLTERWFAGGDLLRQGLVPPYPPDDIYLHPFGWLQIYALWNQYNRRMIELSGSAAGLKLADMPPDLIDTYQVVATTDAGTEVTNVKEFMLVGMEQDYQEGQWNLSLSETYDSAIGKDFTTPLTFKYES
jgi:hypothetical protein